MDEALFEATVGAIYEAAVAPGLWPDLLRRLGESLRCHNIVMVRGRRDRSQYQNVAVGVGEAEHAAYMRRFHRAGPLRTLAPPAFAGHITELHEIMPRREFIRTECYEAYFGPNDIGDGVRLTMWHDETSTQTISLCRSGRVGPMTAEELALARRLTPHLMRMAAIETRLRGADLMRRWACEALDAVKQPVLLVDDDGRVTYANEAGETILAEADGLAASRFRLMAATPAVTRALEALVARAAGAPGRSGALQLPRPSGRRPLALVALPLRGEAATRHGGGAIICVSDLASRRSLGANLLNSLFRLTPAEIALGQDLLDGHQLGDVADRTGRSVHTLRTHLSQLFAKTDTRRQSDLVQLLERVSGLTAVSGPADGTEA